MTDTSNRVKGATSRLAGFVYNDGNVTGDGLNQYAYDAENRLCASYNFTTTAVTSYVYEGNGNRVTKGTLSG